MNVLDIAKVELELVKKAIDYSLDNLGYEFEEAVNLLNECKGKVVVTGLGKTGIIGRKLAATLTSTGTTAIFLHAAEGVHGDLGMLSKDDVVIAISSSGNSGELVSILPFFKFMKVPVIAMTANRDSKLAMNSDIVLDCSVPENSEPFGLVPTVTTTITLILADAVAVALLKKKDFQIQDFARVHPGGTIGRKLLLRVEDLMHTGESNPTSSVHDSMKKVIMTMTTKGLGCSGIIDDEGKLRGIITDGDLRRLLSSDDFSLNKTAEACMTVNPRTVSGKMLAVKALTMMEDMKITMLPVIDENGNPAGMLHMHDLIQAGVVG